MKDLIKFTLAATLVAGAAASGSHHHQHRHVKKSAGSKVEKRNPDPVTKYVVDATATVYQLAGKPLDADKAKAGLDGGEYVVVGESTPTFVPPPAPTSTKAPNLGAQFIESKSSSSSTHSTTSSPPPPPKSTAAAPSSKPANPSSGATGLNAEFPSGQVKCSEFPSKYGAVYLDWLNFGGWSGIQKLPGFQMGLSDSISSIITAIAGENCGVGAACSYACPPGYQKTQWPAAQGSTGQSIGGLYCNSQGYLELTRPSHKTLCEPGAGGVTIQNDLPVVVSTCRTDYPGTESMNIPVITGPGESGAVCNPDQSAYYQWKNQPTSAQYYINKKGYGADRACVWGSQGTGLGNFAPLNLGVGQAPDGTTYISIFFNTPTTTTPLDFNVEIKGDVSTICSYSAATNSFSGGTAHGCTTGLRRGGKAVVRYF